MDNIYTQEDFMKDKPISFRLDTSVIEHLKQISRERSAKEKKDIHYVDLIREAIQKTFPAKDKK